MSEIAPNSRQAPASDKVGSRLGQRGWTRGSKIVYARLGVIGIAAMLVQATGAPAFSAASSDYRRASSVAELKLYS